jgi:hypothetical protein
MIIRNDATSQFPFVPIAIGRDGRPMTEEAGHSSIRPRIWQFYRLTGAIADKHNNLCLSAMMPACFFPLLIGTDIAVSLIL